MKTIVGRDSLKEAAGPAAVAIGTFDGVHIGHRALIGRTLEHARKDDLVATVLTWDRHPAATLRPDKEPPQLATPERKVELIQQTGIDQLVVLEFDETLSRWTPQEFVRRVLVEGLEAGAVLVGSGWRFGHKAAGDVDLLGRLGVELGFSVVPLELSQVEEEPASSTRVRRALADGDLALVRSLLGRPFDMDGVVKKGDGRGTGLGWPTANLAVPDGFAHPPRGIYAGRARVGSEWWPAAISVGVNPTFGGQPGTTPVRVEAYLIDFSGDLYDQPIRIEFHQRLRDELKFDSVDELTAQIARDVEDARRLTS
ncbi:MAG: bifunctional riboflavin kinase/FAD synthetase [Actinomycetota bacterium]|nr:bifunctional riboflavin kinase/FAD synthetase [Actinomycetota bacterium]